MEAIHRGEKMMRRSRVVFLAAFLLTVGIGHAVMGKPPSPGDLQAIAPAGSLSEARMGHTATLLSDGRVLVVGGVTSNPGRFPPALDSAEVWDPATGTFTPTGSLVGARFLHTATLLDDGRALITGGVDSGQSGSSGRARSEVWDPATGTFTPTGSLVGARFLHTATLLDDGRVLINGGLLLGDSESGTRIPAEVWDPATGTFGPAGALLQVRSSHTATLLDDGRVLIVGGLVSGAIGEFSPTVLWDPDTGAVAPTAPPAHTRADHTATLLPDGSVLIVGGRSEEGGYLDSAEVWDPATASFSPTGSLAEARADHTATLLPDRRVLVVGGTPGAPGVHTSAEVWDPETGSFSPAGSLARARRSHTATLLPSDESGIEADFDCRFVGRSVGGSFEAIP